MAKFTKVPSDAFQKLQLNAGVLVDGFAPSTGTIGNLIGATTGGIAFASNPTFSDFAEDVDNAPNNMKEFKHLESFDPTMSGTFLTVTPAVAKMLVGAADVAMGDSTKVVPRDHLVSGDFADLWWIGDYSDVNTGLSAGFIAIHLLNALNTSGFQIQSTKNGKGQMSFEFHGHYSVDSQETVPFEIYVKSGSGLEGLIILSEAGSTTGKSKITVTNYTLTGSEAFVYQTAQSIAPEVAYGDSVSGWTTLTNGGQITPTAGHTKISVAVKDASGNAIALGNATLVIA